jgi:glucose-6-phosphate 1-dehydrogenase
VPASTQEEDVDPAPCTETFAEVAFGIDRPRWSGARFVLRAGKAFARRRKLVLLHFRGGGELELGIDGPEELFLRLPIQVKPLELRANTPTRRAPASLCARSS